MLVMRVDNGMNQSGFLVLRELICSDRDVL